MMVKVTCRQFLFPLLAFIVLTGCNRRYSIENDVVYYYYYNEGTGKNKMIVENADAKTFQNINIDCGCEFTFGRDKKYLYIDGKTIKNIDPKSFKFIGNYIFRDKDSAYFFGFYDNINDCVINGVDPNKIQLIRYPWSKAGNYLIYGKDTLYLRDIDDFVPIDEHWGKTKMHVINNCNILENADPATFKVITAYSGMDKYHRYEFGKIVD